MPAARPSSNFKDKTNITPSVNRKTEATAEDFQEAGQIFDDHANRIDQLENELYHQDFIGYFSSLASLQANYPTAPDQSFAIIVNGANVPQEIYRYINNTWTASQTYKAILTYPTKADFPNPGQEETLYFAKDNKKSWLWYDSKYNDITPVGGAAGAVTASDVAVDSTLLAQTDGATQEEVNEDFDTAITANEQQAEENRTELESLNAAAVKTTAQTLTPTEQQQARENIKAASIPIYTDWQDFTYSSNATLSGREQLKYKKIGNRVLLKGGGEMNDSANLVHIGTLPASHAPDVPRTFVYDMQTFIMRLQIDEYGAVFLMRNGTGNKSFYIDIEFIQEINYVTPVNPSTQQFIQQGFIEDGFIE
ncbi:hypothetical protein [Mesonia sp. HuA40]|uniref:hypothetical protein n=1 Tax=Mesonia sp. HuA40 TaxID=2602761 RepID=UPI0011CB2BCF|nr:hypothetical protein [Mesonia sp. HuA40]TXK73952.1 hypothetical protein FT993_03580 [Mesonia sp. HuA40]